jgi:predicted O-linked N-acetylglucosamine transferase (SPINDLY family)
MELAEKSLRLALELEPANNNARSNLLFCLTHNSTIDTAALFKEHCKFGEIHNVPAAGTRRYTNKRNPNRKLRIGFVSGDFCNHAVAYYFLPIAQHLSRDADLSLHFYYTFGLTDHLTEKLLAHAHAWYPVADLSDAALVKKIIDDGIDIVVDLSGHTAHTRIIALAHKPAPIQASWIGYPATIGMSHSITSSRTGSSRRPNSSKISLSRNWRFCPPSLLTCRPRTAHRSMGCPRFTKVTLPTAVSTDSTS